MNKWDIEHALRNYHWMVREITRLRSNLEEAGEGLVKPTDNMDMPRVKGRVSDPVHMEVSRRERQWKRIEKLEKKLRFVQENIDCITDDRERTVLDCMLDGMTFVGIAHHMGLSEGNVRRLKESIVDGIYEKCENYDLLKREKALV